MFETKNDDGTVTVGGSIDRTRVAELLAEAKDDEQRAYFRGLLGESEEGKAADAQFGDEAASTTTEAPEAPEEDVDALRAEAEELGLEVDGRWGAKRLREEIDAYRAAQ